jgi:hypothetical protein
MDGLSIFGLFAVTATLLFSAVEDRSAWFILAFAGACGLASLYGLARRMAVRRRGGNLDWRGLAPTAQARALNLGESQEMTVDAAHGWSWWCVRTSMTLHCAIRPLAQALSMRLTSVRSVVSRAILLSMEIRCALAIASTDTQD